MTLTEDLQPIEHYKLRNDNPSYSMFSNSSSLIGQRFTLRNFNTLLTSGIITKDPEKKQFNTLRVVVQWTNLSERNCSTPKMMVLVRNFDDNHGDKVVSVGELDFKDATFEPSNNGCEVNLSTADILGLVVNAFNESYLDTLLFYKYEDRD
jgi:hypothetical protein